MLEPIGKVLAWVGVLFLAAIGVLLFSIWEDMGSAGEGEAISPHRIETAQADTDTRAASEPLGRDNSIREEIMATLYSEPCSPDLEFHKGADGWTIRRKGTVAPSVSLRRFGENGQKTSDLLDAISTFVETEVIAVNSLPDRSCSSA